MSLEKNPLLTQEEPGKGLPVISVLYFLGSSHNRQICTSDNFYTSALRSLSPFLNWSSILYFISSDLDADFPHLLDTLEGTGQFLRENPFCRLTVRPVHPLSDVTLADWIGYYHRCMGLVQPFHEEGYSLHSVSRLLLFPAFFVKDIKELHHYLPLFDFSHKRFMLPSLMCPSSVSNCLPENMRDIRTESMPWARLYLTRSTSFNLEEALEILYDEHLLDAILEQPLITPPKITYAPSSLLLTGHGFLRGCIRFGKQQQLEPLQDAHTTLSKVFTSDDQFSRSCVSCTTEAIDRLEQYFVYKHQAHKLQELRYRAGSILQRQGRFKEALVQFEKATSTASLEEIPSSICLQKAICAYHELDLKRAIEELDKARQKDPDSPQIRYYIGLCEFALKDYLEALDRFQETLERKPSPSLAREVTFYQGLSHYNIDEYDDAIAALETTVNLGKQDSPVYFYLALCLLGKKQDTTRALQCLNTALALGPSEEDLFSVMFYTAYALKEIGAYADALCYLRNAGEQRPDSYELHNLRGFCHFKLKEWDNAIACFEKALSINPNSAIDYANIGSNLRDKGDILRACDMYRKALSIDPGITFARDSLSRLEKTLSSPQNPPQTHRDRTCVE